MGGLGAAVPSSPGFQHHGPTTGQPSDLPKPLIDPQDGMTEAVVAVQNRKVELLDEQTAPPLAQDFGTALDQLVAVLSDKIYTGFIKKYLKSPDGAQNLLAILPESFTRRLQNDMNELLSLMSHEYLAQLLCDAISALKHNADTEYTKVMLAEYMTLMEQVFIQQIFTPNERTLRISNQDYERVRMFEALLDLQLLIWERDHCDIDGMPPLGARPWESPVVLKSLARHHGHIYHQVAKDGGPGDADDQSRFRLPGRTLDAFYPPWRKYFEEGDYVAMDMPRDGWLPEELTAEIDKLDALESGFYSLSGEYYLHVGDAGNAAKFSVFLTTGLRFEFPDSSSLYEFINQNHCLFVLVRRLRFSPHYITETNSVGALPDEVIESLRTLNIEQESVSSLTRKQLRGRFRRLAREHHPDKTHNRCTKAFLHVSAAHDTVEQWLQGLWVDSDPQDSK